MDPLREALVIAIDATRRLALADALRAGGVERVVEAEDADGALERVARGWSAPVFIDGVDAGDRSHADACLEILELAPRTKVVALLDTAGPEADALRRRMLRAGAFAAIAPEPAAVGAVVREMSHEAEAAALPY